MQVYKITNTVNSKIYVGKTEMSTRKRWLSHCVQARNRYKNQPIHSAILKYGKGAFQVDCIVEPIGNTYEEKCANLNYLEIYLIERHNTLAPNGYNLKKGGEGGKHHPSTCQKIGDIHRGTVLTQETKIKISNTLKERVKEDGTILTYEQRQNFDIAMQKRKGVPRTDEDKEKMSLASIGKNTGRVWSAEDKQKISDRNKGKKKPNKHPSRLHCKYGIIGIRVDGEEIIYLKTSAADKRFDASSISHCCSFHRWTHKGFIFMLLEKFLQFMCIINFIAHRDIGVYYNR